MDLRIPDFSLVVLVGASGSGKSTFAARHFLPTEVLSSDRCRALVSDDETSFAATADAFDLLRTIAAKRLAARRLTVVDATNLRPEDRSGYLALARAWHAIPVAIVLAPPVDTVIERSRGREDRLVPVRVVHEQARAALRAEGKLHRERFLHVHVLRSPNALDEVRLVRQPLYADRRDDAGPFDIIGDVHGCIDELVLLLDRLGYAPAEEGGIPTRRHPRGRRALFLGDLVDRGPNSPAVLRLVMDMVRTGAALCLPGNHEIRLKRHLEGRAIKPTHGLAATLAQLAALGEADGRAFLDETLAFIDGLVSHFWLDGGRLVVAHAGMKEEMQGRGSGAVRQFAYYGETTGETDADGLPVRLDWAAAYRGSAMVVYGHTPTTRVEWVNKTVCIDTACVFGGHLTALRYPELEIVQVPAARAYDTPARPFEPAGPGEPTAQQAADRLIDAADLIGRRTVTARGFGHVSVDEGQAAAALEVMERFAVDPRWLIHLPATMSPPDTAARAGLLEHPEDAVRYYAGAGVGEVIVQEKHMGSRAIAVVARDAAAARRRFGVRDGRAGRIWTRTGRPFFADGAAEAEIIARLSAAAEIAGLWTWLASDWLCLDAEIMPWTAKAAGLIDEQYRPVGAAALAGLAAAAAVVAEGKARGVGTDGLAEHLAQRLANAEAYDRSWRRHAPPFGGLSDVTMAPFHLLAAEGAVHTDKDHLWHMDVLGRLVTASDGFLSPTAFLVIDTSDRQDCRRAEDLWEELTRTGSEGIVVKPLAFTALSTKGRLVQPALKVRGRDYLRIIYGPDYDLPQHLERLKQRGLGAKRSLAIREFALGIEALHRFVAGEPLRRVHECVFAVLALESEPVDPRL